MVAAEGIGEALPQYMLLRKWTPKVKQQKQSSWCLAVCSEKHKQYQSREDPEHNESEGGRILKVSIINPMRHYFRANAEHPVRPPRAIDVLLPRQQMVEMAGDWSPSVQVLA